MIVSCQFIRTRTTRSLLLLGPNHIYCTIKALCVYIAIFPSIFRLPSFVFLHSHTPPPHEAQRVVQGHDKNARQRFCCLLLMLMLPLLGSALQPSCQCSILVLGNCWSDSCRTEISVSFSVVQWWANLGCNPIPIRVVAGPTLGKSFTGSGFPTSLFFTRQTDRQSLNAPFW